LEDYNLTESEIKYDEELDTRGLYCPEPIFEVRNLVETLDIGL
jgi:TusA-related sulfurtransferase